MNDNTKDDKSVAAARRCDGSREHDWRVCADFAQFIFSGQQPGHDGKPANRSLFNTTAYKIQRRTAGEPQRRPMNEKSARCFPAPCEQPRVIQ